MNLASEFKSSLMTTGKFPPWQIVSGIIAVSLAWILAVDAFTPLGLLIPLFYILIVGLCAWLPRRSDVVLVGLTCSVLTVAGIYFSPPGHEYWMDMVNRTLCVFVIWGVVVIDAARRRAISDLEKAKDKFKALTEAMPHIVLTANPSGRVDFANYNWTRLTNKDVHLAFDSGWLDVIDLDDLPQVILCWRNCLANGEPSSIECRIRRWTDRTFRRHLLAIVPVYDDDGGIQRWLVTATDISQIKQGKCSDTKDPMSAQSEQSVRLIDC